MTTRIPYHLLTKPRPTLFVLQKLAQPAVTIAPQQHGAVALAKSFHHRSNGEGSRKDQTRMKLGSIGICGASYGALYAYWKRRKETGILLAAEGEGHGGKGGSSRRNAYNFVADVVEMSGSAVVFIERLARVPLTGHRVPVSHGSGFIVREEGIIVTNAHVVGNQSKLKVRLQSGKEYEGQVLGVDEGLDLAAIQLSCGRAENLPFLPLGCSSEIRPGEWVVAMGSPLNLTNTVTAGIVSNIHRAGKELGLRDYDKRDMEYIQTDAMINVGNSGGPLINLDGEVIGVNSMMASAGIGFAIPVDYVKDFLQRLDKAMEGSKRRGSRGDARLRPGRRRYIGITMLTLTEDIVDQLRLRDPLFPNVTQGVLVHRVQFNSPADKSGMQDGDVISKINGKDIYSTQDVFQALKTSDSIQVTVQRGNKTICLRVEPEDVV